MSRAPQLGGTRKISSGVREEQRARLLTGSKAVSTPAKDGDLLAAQRASAANTMSHERARATPQGWLGGRRKSAHEFRPIESMVASHWLNSWSHAERVHSVLWLLLAWSSLRAPDSWAPPSSPYKHCSTSVLLSRYCLVCSSNVCGLGGAAYRCSPPISASSRTIFTNSKRRRTLNLQPFAFTGY